MGIPAGAPALSLTHPLVWRPFCFSCTPEQLPSPPIQWPAWHPLGTLVTNQPHRTVQLFHGGSSAPTGVWSKKYHDQIEDCGSEGGDVNAGHKFRASCPILNETPQSVSQGEHRQIPRLSSVSAQTQDFRVLPP